jgi:di/tricarboxylate transporter
MYPLHYIRQRCVVQTCFQATTVSSAMFITAMAANPLAVNLAADALGTTISWGTWALAAIVPGAFTLLTMPLLLYILYPPKVKDTPDAPIEAKKQLKKLGPMSTDEKITSVPFSPSPSTKFHAPLSHAFSAIKQQHVL